MSVTEFTRTYFGTVLGYLWSLMRPLLLFAVLLFVFTQVFKSAAKSRTTRCCCCFNIVLFAFFQEATRAR